MIMNTVANMPPRLTPTFGLSLSDRRSPVWGVLEEHFVQRLADLRAQNDARSKSEIETAYLRGQIAMVKELLELGKDKPSSSS